MTDQQIAKLTKNDNPARWFTKHVETSTGCKCTLEKADPACDVGEALSRVQAQHIGRVCVGCGGRSRG